MSSADELFGQGDAHHASNEIGASCSRAGRGQQYHVTGAFEFFRRLLPFAAGRCATAVHRSLGRAQRALGFGNEKDHPEVAPSQFEMNYAHTEACVAADQVQLYKLVCRQVAQQLDMTASFLPKPVTGVNGSGMHTNLSLARGQVNLFHDARGEEGLSAAGWGFVERILASANDICLILNPSVNVHRRLDPAERRADQASPVNRSAMIRIPLADAKSVRLDPLHRPGCQPVSCPTAW